MSVSTTCRKVIINKGLLSAECLKADEETYVTSSISLDNFLGNVDGKFILLRWQELQSVRTGRRYHRWCPLRQAQGPWGKYVDAKFDLQKLIMNNDGVLTATLPGK